MKKILFVSAATSLNTHALDFACYLSNLTHSRLTGLFIADTESVPDGKTAALHAAVAAEYSDTAPAAYDAIYTEKNGIAFKEACTSREANCELITRQGAPEEEVVHLSRFADMIITDADISFTNEPTVLPSKFMRDIMEQAECPVITAPFHFEGVNELVFCYDGTPSSMYAIRQFTYLLPELKDMDATVVMVLSPGERPGADTAYLDAWMHTHYPHYHFHTLQDERPRSRLLDYLLSKSRSIIVMGAFGRGKLSDFVSPSHALPVLKFSNQPVFVTHY